MGLHAVAVEESERIFGELAACLARYRLHAAVVGDPERLDDAE